MKSYASGEPQQSVVDTAKTTAAAALVNPLLRRLLQIPHYP
jgi:hypothetical protein